MTLRVCSIGGIELRVHPLAAGVLLIACLLGRLTDFLQAMLALTLHEAAHVVVARAFGCRIRSVELQPFGGVARMHDQRFTAHAERCIAAAGPIASFIIAGVFSLAYRFAPGAGTRMEPFMAYNIALGAINLLPAVPLDGGRIVRGALSSRLGASLAGRITAWSGVLCGVAMLAVAVFAALRRVYNLTLPVMGLFLLLAAAGELRTAQERQIAAVLFKNDILSSGGGMDVHLLAAHRSMRGTEALRLLRTNRFNLIRVVDSGMHTLGELDEGALIYGLARMGVDARMDEILSFDRTQRL